MTHTYTISGMTCKSCVAKVKSRILSTAGVEQADVQLEAPQATITMQKHIELHRLKESVKQAGNYTIEEADGGMKSAARLSWYITYKPLLLMVAYITGVTLLLQVHQAGFSWLIWMQHFMVAFFLVFSFFKLLDIKAFARSYSMYDVVAKKWYGWGYVYPFAELAIGIAYIIFPGYSLTNIVTLCIMGISIAGVLQAVIAKRKIQCACLGAVFNLPMSSITILEDGLMIGMSSVMLLTMSR